MTSLVRPRIVWIALVACAALGCNGQSRAKIAPSTAPAFQPDPPAVYVAKVKDILVGLPPSDDELAAVTRDPSALGGLIQQWMQLPQYQQKMLVFFELAFQQTQITTADFTDAIPPLGLGIGPQVPLLLQNLQESFARTVLALVSMGRPITDAFATHQLMMTTATKELYALLDARHVDDNAVVTDDFATANPTLNITLEASAGPIAIADSLNPASPSYMHFYNPSIGTLTGYPDQTCNTDPIVAKVDSYFLHNLLYGGVFAHKGSAKQACPTQYTANGQWLDSDFSDWTLVTLRAPNAGEATTTFYDLPSLRTASELVLKTAHAGFFSTPAFGANWPTNTSNQMRVTLNQTLIVATGTAIDGTDPTVPPSTPGLDQEHAQSGQGCYGCHQLLDPTRSILANTWSWYYYPQSESEYLQQKGLFAFQGVVAPVNTIDDFAQLLATHPLVPSAWVQKLCYWANSAACDASDPEFQRLVTDFGKSNLSWSALLLDFLASPIVTHTATTTTAQTTGEVIAVARRDHLCAALDNRLGLSDVCGLDAVAGRNQPKTTVSEIVSGLPSDGYGRGSPVPVLPNQPTLFYRAGLENICEAVSQIVVDGGTSATQPNAKQWSSTQPDAALADFVAIVMGLGSHDARAPQALQILKQHFTAAQQTGATATSALRSTFVTACLSPSFIGIGM